MTKEELKKLSDDTFFDNDTGEIQPESHRNFNNHLIDHTETITEAALRNAKEYTDVREVAILAAADTKDEATLRTAKEYADRIVAALAGSAPETLDTLQELAAALGDDPNFSATVMQMIGERVTTEALAAALAGKADKNGNVSEPFYVSRLFFDTDHVRGLFCGSHSSVLNDDDIFVGNWRNDKGAAGLISKDDPCFYRVGEWIRRTLWHSGNFDPNSKQNAAMEMWSGDCNDWTEIGRLYYVGTDNIARDILNAPSQYAFGLIVIPNAARTQIAFDYQGGVYMRTKHWSVGWQSWKTMYHSGNLKPTYYAQIDPLGNIVSKSADWIQSVTWKNDGYGMQCWILPKTAVNLVTAHVTRVRSGGNTFKGRAPVVCDELLDGCIVVATPGDSGASETSYFNISIQGA